MNANDFWRLIERGLSEVKLPKALPEWLERELCGRPDEEIADFEAWLAMFFVETNDERLWVAGSIISGCLSDDGFVYFRCWLIAQGEQIFRAALANPDSLANIEYKEHGMYGPLIELEQMLYVANRALNKKRGNPPFTATQFPPGYKPPLDCVLIANERKNQGILQMDEDPTYLRAHFPKLMSRFRSEKS